MAEEQVEKIVNKINQDARSEASKIVGEAEEEAEKKKNEAESKSEEIYQEIIERYKREAGQEKQRIVANAKLQKRKEILDAREEVIQESFQKAREKLENLPSKEYKKILENLILEAMEAIDGDAEVMVRKEDGKAVNKNFLQKLSKEAGHNIEKSKENISAVGGVVVRSKDGKIEVDNTFDTRLERYRGEMRREVAKILFGG